MPIDIVILAGAPAGSDMLPEDPERSRAMIELGDKTMLQWVVDAFRASKSAGRIIAVGNVSAGGLDEVIAPSDSFLGNLMLGVEACPDSSHIVVSTSDIPMITPESIDDFVSRAIESGGDMCYPIIPIDSCRAKYPDMKRTCLKLKEGTFTGGNMMMMSTGFLRRNQGLISGAYAARKKPLALASMVGLGLLLRIPLSQLLCPCMLPTALLEKKVSKMLGGKVAGIRSEYAEIGSDIDKLGDLEQAKKLF